MSGVLFSGSSPPKADHFRVLPSKCFYAFCTQERPFAFVPRGNMAPLKVGLFLCPVRGVIVSAKKFSCPAHFMGLVASVTLSHSWFIKT